MLFEISIVMFVDMFKSLRYKIRKILIKNQKYESREIFSGIHWIDQYNKIAESRVRTKNVAVLPS